jgi:hypothetical protein
VFNLVSAILTTIEAFLPLEQSRRRLSSRFNQPLIVIKGVVLKVFGTSLCTCKRASFEYY